MKHIQLILFTFLLCIFEQALFAQTCAFPGDDAQWSKEFGFPGLTNGQINSMVVGDDSLLYAVGYGAQNFGGNQNINRVGVWNGQNWSKLDNVSCTQCGSGSSYYKAVTKDNQGNLYFLGFFNGAENPNGNFVASKNVIQYNVFTKQFTALGKGIGGGTFQEYNAIAWRNDTLYIGGKFTEAYNFNDTVAISNIALFDLNQQTWSDINGGTTGNGNSLKGTVNAITFGKTGEVFVGGEITQAGSPAISVNGVARWKPNMGWDNVNGGTVQVLYGGTQTYPGTVQSLAFDTVQNKLYAGGIFGEFVGSAGVYQQRGLAVYNGSTWAFINSVGVPVGQSAFSVNALFIDYSDNAMYVGGSFRKSSPAPVNNPPANRIAKLNLSTYTFSQLNNGATAGNQVYAILKYQNQIYFGGSFSEINDTVFVQNFASFDGTTMHHHGNGISSNYRLVNTMIPYQNGVLVGGSFESAGGLKDITSVAYWNGQNWEDIGVRFYDYYYKEVRALKQLGNKLWVGGYIYGFGSTISKGLGVFDLTTKNWTTFGAGLAGGQSRINTIEVFKGEIYVGGSFSSIDGVSINHLAKWNGTNWTAVGTFPTAYSDEIDALYNQGDSLLFIGGQINNLNNDPNQDDLVIFDGTNFRSVWGGLNTGGRVRALAGDIATGVVYFGGDFFHQYYPKGSTQLQDIYPIGGIAAGDSIFQVDVNMLPSERGNVFVTDIEVDKEGTVIIGGKIPSVNGVNANNIFRYHPQKGVGFFGSGIPETVNTPIEVILAVDSGMYVGGALNHVAQFPSAKMGFYKSDNFQVVQPSVHLGADSLIGYGSLIVGVQPVAGVSYQWNTGQTLSSILVDTTGWYVLTVGNGGCSAIDSVFVTILPARFLVGGFGDGFSVAQALQSNPSFYTGSLADGFASASAINIQPSFYLGGQSDGYAKMNQQKSDVSFYKGGQGDGYAKTNMPISDIELANIVVGNGAPSAQPQQVSVDVKNLAFASVSNIPVHLFANGVVQFTDTIKSTIPTGGTYNFTFTQLYAPDTSGNFTICAVADHPTDINENNDTVCTTHISTLALEEWANENWKVFPNPANSEVNILLPEGQLTEIRLFNQTGKMMVETISNQSKIVLKTSELTNGLYYLQLQMNQKIYFQKVLVLH